MLAYGRRAKDATALLNRRSVVQRSYTTSPKRDWRVLFFGTGQVALSSAKLLQSRKGALNRLKYFFHI